MNSTEKRNPDHLEIELPEITPSILHHANSFSGRTTFRSWLLMFLGLLISPFTMFASVMLWGVSIYAATFLMIFFFLFAPGCLAWILLPILALFIIIVIGYLFSFITGLPVGYIESSLARKGNCRNPIVGAIMGSTAGFLGLGIYPLILILTLPMDQETIIPVLIFSAFCVLAAWGGGLGGYWGIKQAAFCERSGNWYGKWSPEKRLPLDALTPLAEQINKLGSDDVSHLAPDGLRQFMFGVPSGDNGSALIIQVRKCPKCPDADVEWHAFLHLQTGQKKQGYLEFVGNSMVFPLKVFAKEKQFLAQMIRRHKILQFLPNLFHKNAPASERLVEWFDIMLPARLSIQLEPILSQVPPTLPSIPPPNLPVQR